MSQITPIDQSIPKQTNHPVFAAVYDWMSNLGPSRRLIDPLRQETAGQAYGRVLEVGVGSGLNFPFYRADKVERIDAADPDTAMLRLARRRLEQAAVPISLTQAPVEDLPWPEATFDSAVAALVFCSVTDQARGFQEIRRVLKSGGSLFLLEHVRAEGGWAARIQDALVPVTTRFAGNCHWNRNTLHTLIDAGFQITHQRQLGGKLQPIIVAHAIRP